MSTLITNETDAIVGVMLAAMRADGREMRAEFAAITLRMEGMPARVRVDTASVYAIAARLTRDFEELESAALLDGSVKLIGADLREQVFSCAAAVVAADDELSPEEVDFLTDLGVRFELAQSVVEDAIRAARPATPA